MLIVNLQQIYDLSEIMSKCPLLHNIYYEMQSSSPLKLMAIQHQLSYLKQKNNSQGENLQGS